MSSHLVLNSFLPLPTQTVQSIALMLANRPTEKPRGTLIVAPVGLLEQWKQEIKTKTNCEPKFRILLHHGPDRTTGRILLAKVRIF
jgi:SNF2 family DNA or RNA helicase